MNPSSAVPRLLHPLVHREPMVDPSWDLSVPRAGAEEHQGCACGNIQDKLLLLLAMFLPRPDFFFF